MPARKTQLDEEFLTQSVTLRGTTYTFRELSGEQYEEFIRMTEGEDGTSDLSAVLKLMAPASLVSPKLTSEQIYKKPMPVFNALIKVVNDMHFKTETPEAAKDQKNGTGEEATEEPGNE